jgi:hypothetical protein
MQINSENISTNSEFVSGNREFEPQNRKIAYQFLGAGLSFKPSAPLASRNPSLQRRQTRVREVCIRLSRCDALDPQIVNIFSGLQ